MRFKEKPLPDSNRDISFRMQFYVELPRQVMNFPILVVTTPIYLFSSVLFVTVRRKALKESS